MPSPNYRQSHPLPSADSDNSNSKELRTISSWKRNLLSTIRRRRKPNPKNKMYLITYSGIIQKNRTVKRTSHECWYPRIIYWWGSLHSLIYHGTIVLCSNHVFCRQGSAWAQQLCPSQSQRHVYCRNYARWCWSLTQRYESRKSSSLKLCWYWWLVNPNSRNQRGCWTSSHSPWSLWRYGH